jgi:hypothetical protein
VDEIDSTSTAAPSFSMDSKSKSKSDQSKYLGQHFEEKLRYNLSTIKAPRIVGKNRFICARTTDALAEPKTSIFPPPVLQSSMVNSSGKRAVAELYSYFDSKGEGCLFSSSDLSTGI